MSRPTLFRRSSFALCLAAGALLLAASAQANWSASGDYQISILLEGDVIHIVDGPGDVQEDDAMYRVYIGGSSPAPVEGDVSVNAEGSGAARKLLGQWFITNGTGHVHTVVGTSNGFQVGQSAAAGALPGVLDILDSDIDGGGINVRKGTLRVDAGSKVGSVEVFDESSAYVTLFSQIGNLYTHEGAYALVQESIASSTTFCNQFGTVIIEDSLLHCGSSQVAVGGHVEIHPFVTSSSALQITNALSVYDGSLLVSGTTATTGSLEMGGSDSDLVIAASNWANSGGLEFHPSSVVGPVEMRVSAGTHYHDGATARVSGHPAYQHLTVTGDGTEFELDGDLRIGEYIVQEKVKTFSGNVTVADGATVIVHGELAIKPLGVLTLEPGGTVYAGSLANEGSIVENGGQLVLPEPALALADGAACAALVPLVRRRRIGR